MNIPHDYWNRGFLYNLKSVIQNKWIHGRNLCVEYILRPDVLGGDLDEYYRREYWTDRPLNELRAQGFKRGVGIHDSLIYWGVDVYAKICNGKQFNINVRDKHGEWLYPQDTSATLQDFMQSNATTDFIKGMNKSQLPAMDLQKIGMVALVLIGAVFGMYMLGVF